MGDPTVPTFVCRGGVQPRPKTGIKRLSLAGIKPAPTCKVLDLTDNYI